MKGRALNRNIRRSGLEEFRCVKLEGPVGHVRLDVQDLNPLEGYELGQPSASKHGQTGQGMVGKLIRIGGLG